MKNKRWDLIISEIRNKKVVNVNELAKMLNVSSSTIRRDLNYMEDLNIIRRYYGGAKIVDEIINEPPMAIKSSSQERSKKDVALLAARLIKDNQMIYIDAGSSTYEMIDFISAKNITVVTTGIPHISKLGKKKNIHTIVLGGTVKWSTEAITGRRVLEEVGKMLFDVSFMGVNGIHERVGFTCTSESESEVKAKVIEQSSVAYGLVDNTKFNKLFPEKFADLKDIILLSDYIDNFNKDLISYMLIDGTSNV